ncbi:MAG TPA: bifunctional phosphoribosyl-AMP cyclohydrolase/phosphoribosyl-ATP diphosphatase HisIE [Pyrinomonadaceae bacterium]|nr:bifunctional phosphoribosyl-AMP cyclohydrolase/phosphoribosyl-ATP diphosphatase HisIE [Pyrinomonadaceae bacterium]
MKVNLSEIKFDAAGLIPAVVQDVHTREVLTLAFMNSESLSLTLETGQSWFWSRSRQRLWKKGETSGNTQEVVEIKVDCDFDALVLLVKPAGPACHTGATSCFHNSTEGAREGSEVNRGSSNTLSDLYKLIAQRKQERPDGSYTTYLFDEGLDKILKKVGEESAESIIAAKNQDPQRLVSEVADLTFHLLVMLVEKGVSLDQIQAELESRSKKRLTEKNA